MGNNSVLKWVNYEKKKKEGEEEKNRSATACQ